MTTTGRDWCLSGRCGGGLLLLTGTLLLALPHWLFPVCQYAGLVAPQQGTAMVCATTARLTTACGVVTLCCGAALLCSSRSAVRRFSLYLAWAAAVALYPLYLFWPGVCGAPTMACRIGTLPAVLLVTSLQLAVTVAGLVLPEPPTGEGRRGRA